MDSKLVDGIKAIRWKSKYKCADGTTVIGVACTQVTQLLREEGWRRVPKIDACDLRMAGFTIVTGRYASGASDTRGKDCKVVVLN